MSAEYDAIASQYDITFQALPYRIFIEEWSVLQTLGAVNGLSILELACGTGHYARRLRNLGARRVVGVDLAPEMIGVAKTLEEQSPLGISYHVHDVATLELAETFDRVLAVYLLHYAPDARQLEAMAQAIVRHLKPGGRFVSYQLNPAVSRDGEYYVKYGLRNNLPATLTDGQEFSFNVKLGDQWSPPITVHYWSAEALVGALERAGLTDIRWHQPTASPQTSDAMPAGHWQDYLDQPHCMVLEAAKA